MQKIRIFSAKRLARAGVIAGLYVVASLITMPIASGVIQFRIAEALTILPLFFIEAVPALFVGCILSNVITGCVILDTFLGSVITLISATLTFIIGKIIKKTPIKIFLGGLFPVLLNALILPIIWQVSYGYSEYIYPLSALFLIVGQSLAVYGVGSPLFLAVNRLIDRQSIKK